MRKHDCSNWRAGDEAIKKNKDRPDHMPSDQELEKRLLNTNSHVFDDLSDDKKQQITIFNIISFKK